MLQAIASSASGTTDAIAPRSDRRAARASSDSDPSTPRRSPASPLALLASRPDRIMPRWKGRDAPAPAQAPVRVGRGLNHDLADPGGGCGRARAPRVAMAPGRPAGAPAHAAPQARGPGGRALGPVAGHGVAAVPAV